ncbi:MAG: cell shape determination protein CcmA [Gammaproteobacteria bacterium HGW-Gammaproteobacteria-6]|jgi:cytoskeletal protein CcmA (bactofilin family)|nr:polymer-forming cytoskeletal protein [Xanthomonadaceae bacterium]MDZ4376860.1 polymer-forming cytoskeletal protein [Xanthomonadaceae bacterium]PKM02983.1 MAG: cell shape determination protein CcmA [Gammaproteobacteria bacterium HGW-Gammaproteobacteria-6]PKM16216.1 MAG: cell shape determination protein CcmA [Gammaproteobacteria bacterium HGW-Gammaproteobacteria-2]
MLGRNKRSTSSSGQVDTLIGSQVSIRGDVTFSGGLYVEGRIHGAVCAEEGAKAILTLSEHGFIEGEVRVPVVIVNGQLDGDLYASDRIELGAHARVQGNIHYRVVEMAAGAMITGRLIHDELPPKQLSGPSADNTDNT